MWECESMVTRDPEKTFPNLTAFIESIDRPGDVLASVQFARLAELLLVCDPDFMMSFTDTLIDALERHVAPDVLKRRESQRREATLVVGRSFEIQEHLRKQAELDGHPTVRRSNGKVRSNGR